MRVVVRPHRPVRNAALLGIGAALLALLIWWLLDFGHWRTIDKRRASSGERADLWALAKEKTKDNEKLREQVALAERTAAIDKQTAQEVQELVGQLQQQVFELTQEIDFYRGILVTPKPAKGLRIQGISVEGAPGKGRYRYRLVLTHAVQDDRSAKGKVTMALNGMADGVATEFDVGEIAESDGSGLEFEFKYFQRLEGTFVLPGNFEPRQILVTAREATKRIGIERSYAWREVFN